MGAALASDCIRLVFRSASSRGRSGPRGERGSRSRRGVEFRKTGRSGCSESPYLIIMPTTEKVDLYKLHKNEYVTPKKPVLLDIQPARYLSISGTGGPGGGVAVILPAAAEASPAVVVEPRSVEVG